MGGMLLFHLMVYVSAYLLLFRKEIGAAQLPEDRAEYLGNMTVTGWGGDGMNTISPTLQKVVLNFVSDSGPFFLKFLCPQCDDMPFFLQSAWPFILSCWLTVQPILLV